MLEPAFRATEDVIVRDSVTGCSFVLVRAGGFITEEQAKKYSLVAGKRELRTTDATPKPRRRNSREG